VLLDVHLCENDLKTVSFSHMNIVFSDFAGSAWTWSRSFKDKLYCQSVTKHIVLTRGGVQEFRFSQRSEL